MIKEVEFSMLKAVTEHTNRLTSEAEHSFRCKFSRDRDRILYSKEYRRLAGKTQVFVVGFDDNQRTRLTHTLEVAQIAKTISTFLGFNNTLTEAIALGHDVGHTPFGHVGERTLNYIMNNCNKLKDHYKISIGNKGFKHNWQGIRVVTDLEKISDDYTGLNLTTFTLWGILHHSKTEYNLCKYSNAEGKKCNLQQTNVTCDNKKVEIEKNPKEFGKKLELDFYEIYNKLISNDAWTFEALVVRIADEIAQRHHDTEDSLLAKLFQKNELLVSFKDCFNDFIIDEFKVEFDKLYDINDELFVMHFTRFVIDFLVKHLLTNVKNNLNDLKSKYNIVTEKDFYNVKSKILADYQLNGLYGLINYDKIFIECEKKYQDIIWKRILLSHLAQSMDGKSNYIILRLFKAYITNPQQLADNTLKIFFRRLNEAFPNEGFHLTEVGNIRKKLNEIHFGIHDPVYFNILHRTICDFIAGTTDNYAIKLYDKLYGTHQVFSNGG